MEDQPDLPVYVMVAEEAQPMPMQGATVTSIATSIHTGGAWSLVKYTASPHFSGPPLHWHQHTMEAFYILDGTLAFTLGERTITASVGAFILVPPGVVHTFFNPTAASATYLVWFSPGGHEQYFQEVALLGGIEPCIAAIDDAVMNALNQKYDQFVVLAV